MKKLVVAIGLLLCGLAVFVLGSPHYRIFAMQKVSQSHSYLKTVSA